MDIPVFVFGARCFFDLLASYVAWPTLLRLLYYSLSSVSRRREGPQSLPLMAIELRFRPDLIAASIARLRPSQFSRGLADACRRRRYNRVRQVGEVNEAIVGTKCPLGSL